MDDDRAVRAEIIDTIVENFYRPVNEMDLERASLKGIIDSLDNE